MPHIAFKRKEYIAFIAFNSVPVDLGVDQLRYQVQARRLYRHKEQIAYLTCPYLIGTVGTGTQARDTHRQARMQKDPGWMDS